MAHAMDANRAQASPMAGASTTSSRPAYQAYRILHLGFVVAPIVAGLDKSFHLSVNWDQHLAPLVARLSPIGGHQTSAEPRQYDDIGALPPHRKGETGTALKRRLS